MTDDELQNRFTYHAPDALAVQQHERIRTHGFTMATAINDLADSREKSLALTKVEEAVMWANAAIARHK